MSEPAEDWTQWNLRIGVDVGGTNIDAVLMKGDEVLSWHKSTTGDVAGGVADCIQRTVDNFLANNEQAAGLTFTQVASRVRRVCIGTTHFVNAVVQRRQQHLARVAVIRLCGKSSIALPPFCSFPESLAECMKASPCHFFARGGYEFNQQPSEDIDPEEIRRIARELQDARIHHVVVSCIFSTLDGCGEQETRAAQILREELPNGSVTLSHEVGQMGLLERENAAIMNESLKPLCRRTVQNYGEALRRLGLTCPFYLTKNDGTLVSAHNAMTLPVCTFSCGPTNSMRGAYLLCGLLNAVIIDIGGTTSDAGCTVEGFPRQASSEVRIAGVPICYSMPDTISIGLGGGSLVRRLADGTVTVGRDSVGHELTTRSIVFGGTELTASDVAVASGLADGMKQEIGAAVCEERLAVCDQEVISAAHQRIQEMFYELVDIVKGSNTTVDVILVGGGEVLIDTTQAPPGVTIHRPEYCQVANAVGAALGQISGYHDGTYTLNDQSLRARYHERFKAAAEEDCESNGALRSSIVVREPMESALGYLPSTNGKTYHIRVMAIGDVDETRETLLREDDDSLQDQGALCECVSEQVAVVETAAAAGIEDEGLDRLVPTEMYIDPATKEWLIDRYGAECIVVGAGLLGCGGGGSPSVARLRVLQALRDEKRIRIIDPARIGSCPELDGRVGNVAFMGSPTVSTEKLVAGHELLAAVCSMQKLINKDDHPDIVVGEQVLEVGNGATAAEATVEVVTSGLEQTCKVGNNWKDLMHSLAMAPQKIVALMPDECGGMNCIEPMVIAAELDLPIVDCDGMGRAFPELQMYTPTINGTQPAPCVLVAPDGRWCACTHVTSASVLEVFMRNAVTSFGCVGATSMNPLVQHELQHTVHGSLTLSYRLGDAVLRARQESSDPVRALVAASGGVDVVRGKIVDQSVGTAEGFARGFVVVEAFATTDPARSRYQIDIQNEFICCHRLEGEERTLVVCVPHLITIVDNVTGFPITTEELRTGARVAVVAIRASEKLLTEQALPFVGPTYFMKDERYGGVTKPVFPA